MTRFTVVVLSLIAISLILSGISDAKIDEKNIMGIWLFDEGKGDVAKDASGNGNDGKINGATWDEGKFGNALSFDGAGDWVEVAHSPTVAFDAGTSFTITVHYKGTKVGGALVGKNYEDTSQATPWYLLWDDGRRNQVTMYLRDEAGTSFTAHSTSGVADDDWHFIVGVVDASAGKASMWIDGEQESEVDFNKESGYGTSEGVFHIGRHYDRYTEGIIDDVGLFNIALDEKDIIDLMKNGLSGITVVSHSEGDTGTIVNAGNDHTANLGNVVTVNATFTDPVSTNVHTAVIDWGDGTVDDGTVDNTGIVTGSHIYVNTGTYTVIVTITSSDGESGTDTLTVTITITAPTVDAGDDQIVSLNDTVNINASFTDPDSIDTHTATIDWGDGTVEAGILDAETQIVTGSHAYSDSGIYEVTVTVTDNHGSTGNDTFTVHVGPNITVISDLQFGNVVVGKTATVTVHIGNTGNDPLNVIDINTNLGDILEISETNFTVPPLGATHDITLTLTPTSPREISGTLTIISNDPNSSEIEIAITGKAIERSNVNLALSLDGDGDYVEVNEPFTNDTVFTISLWVNPNVINDNYYHGFIGKQGDQYRKPGLWLAPSNESLHYDSYSDGVRYYDLLEGFFTNDRQWIHVAWVKDNTEYRFYRNGLLFATRMAPASFYTADSSYWIGRVDNYWDGLIDEVRVWNIPRTQEEIQATMNIKLKGDEPGLVSYWDFDDGNADDLTANHNDGVFKGNAEIIEANDLTLIDSKPDIDFTPEQQQLKWQFQADGLVSSSPAIGSDGTIYVGSGRFLSAINPDGTQKWKFKTGDAVYSSPAIGFDGTIYVGSHDDHLYAINLDGTLKWKFKTDHWVHSSPAIGFDGTIYVGSHDTHLYAINPDGTQKWKFKIGRVVSSSPAIGSDGTIYVGSSDNFSAINPDGTQKWKKNFWVDELAIGSDGTIYVGSGLNYFYATNPNGTKKWEFQTDGLVKYSPAIGSDGTIYVGSHDGHLYAVNPDGTEKWRFKTGHWVDSSPAIGFDGTIYVGSHDTYLYAINPDGMLKWKFQTDGLVRSSPAIGFDGTIYVGSSTHLYAFNSDSLGLADSPWPKFRHDNQNTGSVLDAPSLPQITVSPTPISLGDVIFGKAVTIIIRINSSGREPLKVTDITSTLGESISISETAFTVPPGATHDITLTLTPSTPGDISSELIISSNDADSPTTEIAINLRVGVAIRVPQDQPTIQAGIDAAVNGDTVLVDDGTYTGEGNVNLVFDGKAITMRSVNGPTATIIDCENTVRGFNFGGEDANSVLDGFTITNGSANSGGGIYCEANPTIINCIITNNTASEGGGIYIFGNPTVINCLIVGNNARRGGGIFTHHVGGSITNCIIANNTAESGGGIELDNGPSPTIRNSIIWGNTPDGLHDATPKYGGMTYNPTLCALTGLSVYCNRPVSVSGGRGIVISYCDIQGGYEGEGNMDFDPMFVDSDNGNYHLQDGSPCVDSANCENAPAMDIEGLARPQGDGCEMGCYEYFDSASILTTIPAPTNLKAAVISSSRLELSWQDNSNNEDGFEIFRKKGTGNFMLIAILRANVTHYSDIGLQPNTSYTYRVRTTSIDEFSEWSNQVTQTTPESTMLSESMILLESNQDGDFEIYTMNPDGSALTQLIFNSDKDTRARWSPDGNRIVSIRNDKEIWIMDSDGENQQFIHDGNYADFSPDGQQLVFSDFGGFVATGNALFIYDFQTEKASKLINLAGTDENPDWSPDGQSIVFASKIISLAQDIIGVGQPSRLGSTTVINLVNAKGEPHSVELTEYTEPLLPGSLEKHARFPRWSPDGNKIIYQDSDRILSQGEIVQENHRISVMDTDGSHKIQLTPVSLKSGTEGLSPIWSPDGYYILFSSYRENTNAIDIVMMNSDGSNVRFLTDTPEVDEYPLDWIPTKMIPPIPVSPTELLAVAASGNQINLSWKDNSNDEDGFQIERQNDDGNFIPIATVEANVSSYSDAGLQPGKTYTYRVRAYSMTEVSNWSNEVAITPGQHSAMFGQQNFKLALQEGINLISIPLNPGEKDGKSWRLSELIEFIGSDATMIIRYDKAEKKFLTYMPTFPKTSPANAVVQDGEGYIVMMKKPASVTFTGTAWDGMVSLAAGINLISVPMNPGEEWRLSDLMSFIGKDAAMVISYDKAEKKFLTHMPHFSKAAPSNKLVQGGEGYIVMMSAPSNVSFTGSAWENATLASPPLMVSTLDNKVTPFFVVEGFVTQKETDLALNNVKVLVNNQNNSLSVSDVTGTVGDDGRYVVTFADVEGNYAMQVGDVIEVVAKEPTGAFSGNPIRYTIKANDIRTGKISLGNLRLLPIPNRSALLQNYPNPFNPETWIPYQLANDASVTISIYNITGQIVRTIALGKRPSGFYLTKDRAVHWDGKNSSGEKVASGVYYYMLQAEGFRATRKMVILK